MRITKKQKSFVQKCAYYACDILLLNSYGRTWNFYEKGSTDKSCQKAADIDIDLKYKELIINIYPMFWNQTEYTQFIIIFHEFCHVITEQQYMIGVHYDNNLLVTRREIEYTREHETSLMEKAFIWILGNAKQYKETANFIKKLSNTSVNK